MKRIAIISALLLLALGLAAQTRTNGSTTTVNGIVELNETIHDFGDVITGSGPLSVTFKVKNISSDPQVIYSVVSSCGCTDVSWTRSPLKPGETGEISATYTNDEGPYPFDKTLTVYVSGLKKNLILRLRGVAHSKSTSLVEKYPVGFGGFSVKNNEILLGSISQGSQRSDAVRVANTTRKPISVQFRNVTPGLQIMVAPNPIPANSEAKMTYIVTTDKSRWGKTWYYAEPYVNGVKATSGHKEVHTDKDKIGIGAMIAEDFSGMTNEQKAKAPTITFSTTNVDFGTIKPSGNLTKTVTYKNSGKTPLIIHKAETQDLWLKIVEATGANPGQTGHITIEADTDKMSKGEINKTVSLYTNVPGRGIVLLYVTGKIV